MLAGNFQTVLFPALAQLQADPIRQCHAAVNASRILSAAVMPYCFLQAALARPVIDLLFGDKWHAAIPLVQILSVGLAFDAVSWLAGSMLSARGEFSRALKYSCLFAPIFFVAIAVGAAAGSATGVATAVSLYYILLGSLFSFLVFRTYGVRLREVAWIYLLPALIAAVAMGGGVFVESSLPLSHGPFTSIVTISGTGLVLYALMMRIVAPALISEVIGRVASLLRMRNQVDTTLSL
jgi:teichuronic acid exporter